MNLKLNIMIIKNDAENTELDFNLIVQREELFKFDN